MGTGQLHYQEYIRVCDAYGAGEISKSEFCSRLDRLGYTPDEIENELEAAEEHERTFG